MSNDDASARSAPPRTQHLVAEWIGAAIILASRLLTAPKSPWESDEMLFAAAVRRFDPSMYHPHPPGYPVFVILGKFVNAITGDPWRALLLLNIVAAPFAFVALTRLFRRLTGEAGLSLCGAFLVYFSAAMLVHGTLAMSDGLAVAFIIAALLAVAKIDEDDGGSAALWTAILSSLAIGCRPQMVVPLIPVLFYALVRVRSMRQRLIAVATFTVVSLLWFVPLVVVAGGPRALLVYETNQARYFAAHDALLSRATLSSTFIAFRFLVHPWGSNFVALPLFVIVLLGIPPAWRRRGALLPIALFTAVYLVFELRWMDPMDGARYNLPAMIFVALLAAFGLGTIRDAINLRVAPFVITIVFAALSLLYVRPIIVPRHETLSAPAAAAAYIRANFPRNAVILADNAMRPDAEYLLPDYTTVLTDSGLREGYDRPGTRLVRFENGASRAPGAKVFSWPESDAYANLTRGYYLRATVDEIPPNERYLPLAGIYDPERDNEGEEWRWIARDASLRLPRAHAATAVVTLLDPVASINESVEEQLFVNGALAGAVTLHRGTAATVVIPLPPGDCVVRIVASRAYVPDEIFHNGDKRLLSAQLLSVVQR